VCCFVSTCPTPPSSTPPSRWNLVSFRRFPLYFGFVPPTCVVCRVSSNIMGNQQSSPPPPAAADSAQPQQHQRSSVAANDAHIIEAAIESVRLEDRVSRLRAATNNGRRNPPPTTTTPPTTPNSDDDVLSSKVPIHNKSGASKQVTDCRIEQRASLACIEQNYSNKDMVCARYFEEYKKCRKAEHERKLEANAKAW